MAANGLLTSLRKDGTLWLMILPTILVLFLFNYLPLVGLYLAFTKFDFYGGFLGSPFVGLENFRFLYQSQTLWIITRNTLLYNLVFIFVTNILQMVIAIMLSLMAGKIYKKICQSVMLLPYFVSFVLLSTLVYFLFNYEFGTINSYLRELGLRPFDGDFYLPSSGDSATLVELSGNLPSSGRDVPLDEAQRLNGFDDQSGGDEPNRPDDLNWLFLGPSPSTEAPALCRSLR